MLNAIQQYLSDNWLLAISTPFYTLLIALEVWLSNYQKRQFYTLKDSLINFWLNIVNTLIGISVKVLVLAILSRFFTFHFLQIDNPYLYWGLLFLGLDLCFYFEHRSEHYCRVLWAVHVTHHSSQEFNLTTGFRSSVFRPFESFWFFIPRLLFGLKPLDILLMDAICQIYGIMPVIRCISIKTWVWFLFFGISYSELFSPNFQKRRLCMDLQKIQPRPIIPSVLSFTNGSRCYTICESLELK